MPVTSFLWSYLKKLKFLFFGFLILQILAEFSRQSGLYFSSKAIGTLTENGDKTTIFHWALFYTGLVGLCFLGRTILDKVSEYISMRFIPTLKTRISKNLLIQAHKHSVQFFSDEMSGRVANKVYRIIADTFELYHSFLRPFNGIMRIIISFFFIINVDVFLGLSLLFFLAIYLTFVFFSGNKMIKKSEESADKESIVNGILIDTLFNYNLVKNDGQFSNEHIRYFQKVKPWVRAEKKLYYAEGKMYITQGALRGILQFLFLIIPFYYWMNSHISITDFILVESLCTYLLIFGADIAGPIARAFRSWGSIQDGLTFLYRPIHIIDKENASRLTIKTADISFQDVSFSYKMQNKEKAKKVFNHFNLEIPAGQKVGLVGASGSGKSSLIKLLNRYYDIQNGQISINKIDISSVTQDSLRSHISLIPQDPSLFNRTIMENIRYGNPKATDEEVIEASKKAYCHDFISRLPLGYQSKVGERGITLSGGERQRIAIARAVLKKAPILVLDEATSALDSESEFFIQQALLDVMKSKTVIAIAHRLSTLREMDRILVMHSGKIIEDGTHTELLIKKGAYYTFYQTQADGFKEAE